MRRLVTCTLHQILLGSDGSGMNHVWDRYEMHKKFWSENLKGKGHSADSGIDGKIILEWILSKYGGNVWTGFM
jgi:hypothetical protein